MIMNQQLFVLKISLILTSSFDKTVKLWEISTGICAKVFNYPGPVNSVQVSYAGKQDLLSSPNQPSLLLLDNSGEHSRQLTDDNGTTASAMSENGKLAAVVTHSGLIKIIQLESDNPKHNTMIMPQLKENVGDITALSFTADNNSIVFSKDRSIYILSIRGEQRNHYETNSKITTLSQVSIFLSLKEFIITGHSDGSIKIHDIKGKQQNSIKSHDASITSMTQSSNYLVTGDSNGIIIIHNLGWFMPNCFSFVHRFNLLGKVTSLKLGYSSDLLIIGCNNGHIIFFDVKTKTILRTIKGHNDVVSSIAMTGFRK